MLLPFLAWNISFVDLAGYAWRVRSVLEYKQMQKQIHEQGPAAARNVRRISLNSRVKKMQRNDKKDEKKVLNEHISKRPHSSPSHRQSSRAISSTAVPNANPEFAGLSMGLLLFLAPVSSPVAVMDVNVLAQNGKDDTVKLSVFNFPAKDS